jgi:hypothetical protein
MFLYHFIQSHKIKKIDLEDKKNVCGHAHNSQLIKKHIYEIRIKRK